MRIEQYFLMTDYSLWEVILNGDSPVLTRVIEDEDRTLLPHDCCSYYYRIKDAKTLMEAIEKRFGGNNKTKKKLISQLIILGESLSQEDINLKFLRSLPTEWRTHTLIWRNKTDLEEQSVDDLFNILKIYEAEVKSSSSASTSTQNIAFVSSQNTDNTNEPVSVVASVSAASAKIHVSVLPNVDTLSNAQIDADDRKEIDLKWKMSMLTVRARKGHFARECRLPKDTRRNVAAEPQRRNIPVETSTSNTDESLPASPIYDRYQSGEGYHAVPLPYTGTFMPPKHDLVFHDAPNVYETVRTAFNVELSPTKPEKDLSHTHCPSTPIIEDWVSDSKDDSEAELLQNAPSFVQTTKQVKTPRPSVKPVESSLPAANHKTSIPKPKNHGNNRNRKACFVCNSLTHLIKDCDYYETKMAQTPARNHAQKGNHQHYARMTLPNPQRHVVPTAVLTKSKLVPLTTARQVNTPVLQP
uniref:Uncharacterized protein n=1 Tax=Tanacetum cinerariifolium TaxID=118510 RepID=A0A699I2W3_TANCI|nr:hypothetical protein [Tanacetum cinerariifolium]